MTLLTFDEIKEAGRNTVNSPYPDEREINVAKDIAHAQLKKVIAEIEALHLLSDDNSTETHQEIFGGLMCEWLEAVRKEIK